MCLIGLPLRADEIATGPRAKEEKESKESDRARYEKWLSV